jgi:uncharacterized DUF497 family protein
VEFEWDPAKAAANLKKHGVSFEEATTTFLDPLAISYSDPDHSDREQRFITVGYSAIERLLFVAHRDLGEERVRIMSARVATRKERREHEEGQ